MAWRGQGPPLEGQALWSRDSSWGKAVTERNAGELQIQTGKGLQAPRSLYSANLAGNASAPRAPPCIPARLLSWETTLRASGPFGCRKALSGHGRVLLVLTVLGQALRALGTDSSWTLPGPQSHSDPAARTQHTPPGAQGRQGGTSSVLGPPCSAPKPPVGPSKAQRVNRGPERGGLCRKTPPPPRRGILQKQGSVHSS